jgi:hypothetical protein
VEGNKRAGPVFDLEVAVTPFSLAVSPLTTQNGEL